MSNGAEYYYSHGERIPLRRDRRRVAVDLEKAKDVKLDANLSAKLRRARPVRGQLYVVDAKAIAKNLRAILDDARALQPVFRHESSLIVVQPEVRVETTTPEEHESLDRFLNARQEDVKVERQRGGRRTIKPRSGRGEDALRIANSIHEETDVKLAQVRFVRIVPDIKPQP